MQSEVDVKENIIHSNSKIIGQIEKVFLSGYCFTTITSDFPSFYRFFFNFSTLKMYLFCNKRRKF